MTNKSRWNFFDFILLFIFMRCINFHWQMQYVHLYIFYAYLFVDVLNSWSVRNKAIGLMEFFSLKCIAYWPDVAIFRPTYSKKKSLRSAEMLKNLHAFFNWSSLISCRLVSKIRIDSKIFAWFFSICVKPFKKPSKMSVLWMYYAWFIYYLLVVELLWAMPLVLFSCKE